MFRYLVAHVPAFRLERCGWLARQPAVLLAEEKSALRVQCATPAAHKGGVRRGMSAAEARAILPTLQTEVLDAAEEEEDLDQLAQQLLRVSPNVAAMPPDSLVAEVSRVLQSPRGPGGQATAGAERALLERVRIRLEQLGHKARVVIADDPATAWACAAWGQRGQVIPPGQGPTAMAQLPLAALDLPLHEAALLTGLGLHTVGAFAALPPASVVGRLGPLAVAAHALARGDAPRPTIAPWQDDQPLVLTQPLLHPVEQLDALLFVLNALLRDAAAHLAATDRAAVRLVLRLTLDPQDWDPSSSGSSSSGSGSGVQELSLRLGAPTRDPRRMLELLRARLDRLTLAGPVLAVTLELPEPADFTGRQRDLLERQRAAEALDDVVARLQDELGSDAICVPQHTPQHRPEAAWQAQAWPARRRPLSPASRVLSGHSTALLSGLSSPSSCHTDLLAQQRPDGTDPVRAWQGFPVSQTPRRPTLLNLPAVCVDVSTDASTDAGTDLDAQARDPDLSDLPRQLHIDGHWQPLVALSGPEALAGDWWRSDFDRLYWCASLADGRRAWLYLEEGHWALHGWFD